eukprot:Hpha_TRINITY_DN13470_c0_g1::TRINITY_DN13470_c0_g1_i1::g.131144::m.131144
MGSCQPEPIVIDCEQSLTMDVDRQKLTEYLLHREGKWITQWHDTEGVRNVAVIEESRGETGQVGSKWNYSYQESVISGGRNHTSQTWYMNAGVITLDRYEVGSDQTVIMFSEGQKEMSFRVMGGVSGVSHGETTYLFRLTQIEGSTRLLIHVRHTSPAMTGCAGCIAHTCSCGTKALENQLLLDHQSKVNHTLVKLRNELQGTNSPVGPGSPYEAEEHQNDQQRNEPTNPYAGAATKIS